MSGRTEEVFRRHYNTIATAILHPLEVTDLLIEKGILASQLKFDVQKKHSLETRVDLLMRAVTAAVKINSDYLKVFIAILEQFPEAAEVAKIMSNELGD